MYACLSRASLSYRLRLPHAVGDGTAQRKVEAGEIPVLHLTASHPAQPDVPILLDTSHPSTAVPMLSDFQHERRGNRALV